MVCIQFFKNYCVGPMAAACAPAFDYRSHVCGWGEVWMDMDGRSLFVHLFFTSNLFLSFGLRSWINSSTLPELLGVFCTGVSLGVLTNLTAWKSMWDDVQSANKICRDVILSDEELITVRERMGAVQCPVVNNARSSTCVAYLKPIFRTFLPFPFF